MVKEQCHLLVKVDVIFTGHVLKKEEEREKGKVPLYFVLYYTLNRSGEIHGKK